MVTSVDAIRQEDQPHGARMIFNGGGAHVATRFRLWSPDHVPVLSLPDAEDGVLLQMEDCGNASGESQRAGWSELIVPARMAPAGCRYLYGFPKEGDEQDLHFVPDFAASQLETDVDSPSILADLRHHWQDSEWKGMPWHRSRILSLHIGTDTKEGTFLSLIDELDDIKDRGYTVIEPLNFGAFAGNRGWGFDCVQPMAPHPSYGTLKDLMTLVDSCHQRGMGFSTQLIQNHLGAIGNYLQTYAKGFFAGGKGEWGSKIDFTHPDVRSFFIQTTRLYTDICHSDMVRFDAVHAIDDPSPVHILKDLHDDIQSVAARQGRFIHVTHENQYDRSFAHLGTPDKPGVWARANWADSIAHAAKCAIGGEKMDLAYYRHFFRTDGDDLNSTPPDHKYAVKALAEAISMGGYNIVYGDKNRKKNMDAKPMSEIKYDPARAIIQVETHDQEGNTVKGISPFEQLMMQDEVHGLQRTKTLLALVILQPSIPMIWNHLGRDAPFPFFHGHTHPDVAKAIFKGRQEELIRAGYEENDVVENMIDPGDEEASYKSARIYGDEGNLKSSLNEEIDHFIRKAFTYREEFIEPALDNSSEILSPSVQILGNHEGISATWNLNGFTHNLTFNFTDHALKISDDLNSIEPYGFSVSGNLPSYEARKDKTYRTGPYSAPVSSLS